MSDRPAELLRNTNGDTLWLQETGGRVVISVGRTDDDGTIRFAASIELSADDEETVADWLTPDVDATVTAQQVVQLVDHRIRKNNEALRRAIINQRDN